MRPPTSAPSTPRPRGRRSTDRPAVRIAVVDTGIDIGHPDLAGKIVGRYDADNGGTTITDTVGHGTFVAGVAAADTGNGIGIAGAGYNTSILGVKIAAPDGSLSIDDEVTGIRWAVAHGAKVINLSLGGTEPSASEKAAIEAAIAKGVLVVAAAGNDGDSVRQYPASYPGVIAVGATDTATHKRADFSSYGSWVTLAAPGVHLYSTAPRAGSDYFPGRTGYAYADGTSFSSPIVAGLVGLLLAQHPGLSVAEVRHALVASARGYTGLGLGAGQIDFASALAHVPPTTSPASAGVVGTADTVTLQARSAAAAVRFRVDGGAYTAPQRVTNGVAQTPFDTWGYADGAHTVAAFDCTTTGECNDVGTSAPFTLVNAAPQLTAPAAGSTASGRFPVSAAHPGGGGVRLLVDGHPAGFDGAAPYTFLVNGSELADGAHQLSTVLCSRSGDRCAGPQSSPVTITTESLHPTIGSLSPDAISPNGDRVQDTATVRFSLPDTESVTAQTIDAGGTVRASQYLGTLAAGSHTWTWRGLAGSGARLPDGRYMLELFTSADGPSGSTRAGYAAGSGTLDTVAPRLSRHVGNGAHVYPVRDGYRDTFSPSITLSATGRLSLHITTTRGAAVRTITATRGPGATRLTWDGRTASGRVVAAGTYHWQYTVIDTAGNSSRAGVYTVIVSAKRLVTRTTYVTHAGTSYLSSGGTDTTCAHARHRGSLFGHGLWMTDACTSASADFAYANYRFTVPGALGYSRIALQVYGHSTHRPTELAAALQRTDGSLEIPAPVAVRTAGNHWHTLASIAAAGHITAARHAYATVLLDPTYAGTNTFDLGTVRLRVTYIGLA